MPSIKNSFKPSPSPKMIQIGGQAPGLVDDFKTGKVVETIELNAQKTNSTAVITNLNADLLDGNEAAAFSVVAHTHVLTAGATDVTSSKDELNVLDGIPATLTATEIGYCDGVTSAIQTQIDGKAATAHTHVLTAGATDITATAAEVNYIDGVTSAIQTQIDGKQGTLTNSAGLAAALNDETGSGAAVFGTSPTFTTSIIMSNGATIGQAAGPLVAFDDTNNYLEITGAKVGINLTDPGAELEVSGGENKLGIFRMTQRLSGAAAYGLDMGLDVTTGDPVFSRIVNNVVTEAFRIQRSTGYVGIGTTPTTSIGYNKVLTIGGASSPALNLFASGLPQEAGVATDGSGLYFDVAGNAAATANDIIFRTGRTNSSYALTEAMRINGSDGSLGIGMAPSVQFELSGSVGQKASGTTWSNPSDKRLKENISPFTDGLNVITKVNPVNYELNGLGGTRKGVKGISVIAQDILEVAPYTINTYKAKLNADDKEETELYRFEASALIFALINSVKDLLKRIETLEAMK